MHEGTMIKVEAWKTCFQAGQSIMQCWYRNKFGRRIKMRHRTSACENSRKLISKIDRVLVADGQWNRTIS